MRRYWIEFDSEQPREVGADFLIDGETYHHIFKVCRTGLGEHFELLGDDNKAWLVEVLRIEKKSAMVRFKEMRAVDPRPAPPITLALSLPKFPVFEAVLEKSVELGVDRVIPFFSDYSFLKSDHPSLRSKADRWQKIIQGATQQSGRTDLMKCSTPRPLSKLLEEFNQDAHGYGLFLYEGQSERTLSEEIRKTSLREKSVWIFVGSEGGFSHQEKDIFQTKNLLPLTLGNQVLRVETACVAALSVLKYECGHF